MIDCAVSLHSFLRHSDWYAKTVHSLHWEGSDLGHRERVVLEKETSVVRSEPTSPTLRLSMFSAEDPCCLVLNFGKINEQT